MNAILDTSFILSIIYFAILFINLYLIKKVYGDKIFGVVDPYINAFLILNFIPFVQIIPTIITIVKLLKRYI